MALGWLAGLWLWGMHPGAPPSPVAGQPPATPLAQRAPARSSPAADPPQAKRPRRLTLAAVGDVLLDGALHREALGDEQGFQPVWASVQPWLAAADVSYANLEGPLGGGKPSGFPRFNHPDRLATDLKASGVDVVSTANNHALDRGSAGLERTLDLLDAAGLAHMGTRHRGRATDSYYTVVERAGVRVAWVACTFETNGQRDARRQVLFCYRDRHLLTFVVEDLARRSEVDVVVVTPHFGLERLDRPRGKERQLARSLIEAGALLVLGAHPHKLHPVERYTAKDGRQGLIAYSLGNFVSPQRRLAQRTGALVQVQLVVDEGGARVEEASYLPLVTTRGPQGTRVRPAEEGSAEARHAAAVFGRALSLLGSSPAPRPSAGGSAAASAR